jgi:hypothetical protein
MYFSNIILSEIWYMYTLCFRKHRESTANIIKPFSVFIISRTPDEQELNEDKNKGDLKKQRQQINYGLIMINLPGNFKYGVIRGVEASKNIRALAR